MEILKSYTSKEAASICGFHTIYMLHYLARQGVVIPSEEFEERRGKRYQYTFRDLVLLKAVQRLLAHGVSVKRLRAAQEKYQSLYEGVGLGELLARFLLTDGKDVFFIEALDQIINLNEEPQLSMHLLLNLKPINEEIFEKAENLTKEILSNSKTNRETISVPTK